MLFHFLKIFWAWHRKRCTKGNGEQAQRVAATNKAAARTRRQRYRQKTGEFEKSSYLLGTGRGRSQLLPTRFICHADAWLKGGGLPGAKHKSPGKWFIFGHKLEMVSSVLCWSQYCALTMNQLNGVTEKNGLFVHTAIQLHCIFNSKEAPGINFSQKAPEHHVSINYSVLSLPRTLSSLIADFQSLLLETFSCFPK